jgi:hypothetical protein
MKTLLTVTIAVVLGACGLLAQGSAKTETAKIAGDWQMALETPHGPMQGLLQVKQDGPKITGTYEIENIGKMELTGKVEGEKVTFSMEVPAAQMTLTFNGKLEGEKMAGSTDHAGNWTATRK